VQYGWLQTVEKSVIELSSASLVDNCVPVSSTDTHDTGWSHKDKNGTWLQRFGSSSPVQSSGTLFPQSRGWLTVATFSRHLKTRAYFLTAPPALQPALEADCPCMVALCVGHCDLERILRRRLRQTVTAKVIEEAGTCCQEYVANGISCCLSASCC